MMTRTMRTILKERVDFRAPGRKYLHRFPYIFINISLPFYYREAHNVPHDYERF
jgi:hypothetical protein